MKFKPFTKQYDFSNNDLVSDFPSYFREPLYNWLIETSQHRDILTGDGLYGGIRLAKRFRSQLQIIMHEDVPDLFDDFFRCIYADSDRMANYLALWLQNYAHKIDARKLEYILAQGGSAYQVSLVDEKASDYNVGVYDLVMRVPKEVKMASRDALESNKLLEEAWREAYSRKPDGEKVVTKCCNFLEGYLGKKYFPNDQKPQLKKFIHTFKDSPNKLSFLGDTIVTPKSNLTDLLIEVSDIRGQHTEGRGRTPTYDEALFVLHATIFIWNVDKGFSK